MLISQPRCHPAARCPIQKSNLNQERLVYFLERVLFFGQRRSQRPQPNRPAIIFLNNCQQQAAIDLVETVRVHFKHGQRALAVGRSITPVPRTCA